VRNTEGLLTMADLIARTNTGKSTVHHWVKVGMLPAPTGRGRAARYTPDCIARIQLIRKLRIEHNYGFDTIRAEILSMSTEQILALVEGPRATPPALAPPVESSAAAAQPIEQASSSALQPDEQSSTSREAWRRIVLVPGLELFARDGSPLVARLAAEIAASYSVAPT
jgi:DNA-binding transcriptional MerR regulator